MENYSLSTLIGCGAAHTSKQAQYITFAVSLALLDNTVCTKVCINLRATGQGEG